MASRKCFVTRDGVRACFCQQTESVRVSVSIQRACVFLLVDRASALLPVYRVCVFLPVDRTYVFLPVDKERACFCQ